MEYGAPGEHGLFVMQIAALDRNRDLVFAPIKMEAHCVLDLITRKECALMASVNQVVITSRHNYFFAVIC